LLSFDVLATTVLRLGKALRTLRELGTSSTRVSADATAGNDFKSCTAPAASFDTNFPEGDIHWEQATQNTCCILHDETRWRAIDQRNVKLQKPHNSKQIGSPLLQAKDKWIYYPMSLPCTVGRRFHTTETMNPNSRKPNILTGCK
jgi:hypothetical protein